MGALTYCNIDHLLGALTYHKSSVGGSYILYHKSSVGDTSVHIRTCLYLHCFSFCWKTKNHNLVYILKLWTIRTWRALKRVKHLPNGTLKGQYLEILTSSFCFKTIYKGLFWTGYWICTSKHTRLMYFPLKSFGGYCTVGCPQISLRSETEAKHSKTFFCEIAKLTPQFRLFRFEAKQEF